MKALDAQACSVEGFTPDVGIGNPDSAAHVLTSLPDTCCIQATSCLSWCWSVWYFSWSTHVLQLRSSLPLFEGLLSTDCCEFLGGPP